MNEQQRERWKTYQREYCRRKSGNPGPDRYHYSDEEIMLISVWTDQGISDDEQAKRLGRTTKRAIQCARYRYGIRRTYEQ